MAGSGFFEAAGQGAAQAADLGLAFVLASAIGLERETRQRSAGLRTYTLVGFGSALVMLVSKYGFGDVLHAGTIVLDPSRIAAQIVTGIGFIGGGLIFVRRDAVRGLTTAAAVWLTAAVGMACGAGLPVLAAIGTAGYFVVVLVYTPLVRRLAGGRFTLTQLRLEYVDGRGVLRRALEVCARRDFAIGDLCVVRDGRREEAAADARVRVTMVVHGPGEVTGLVSDLGELEGVIAIGAGDIETD